jgi:proline iminopeptidase
MSGERRLRQCHRRQGLYEIVGVGDATPLITLHGGPGFTHDYLEPLGVLCKERPVVFYDQLGS